MEPRALSIASATATTAVAAAEVTVTDSTKRGLLRRWLDRRLVHDMAGPAAAMAEGLREVVPAGILALFSAEELQGLLGGGPSVDDDTLRLWRAHAEVIFTYDKFDFHELFWYQFLTSRKNAWFLAEENLLLCFSLSHIEVSTSRLRRQHTDSTALARSG